MKQVLALTPQLDLFHPQTISDAVENSHIEDYLPIGFSVNNQSNPIRFFVQRSDDWVDIAKSYFEIEGTIEGDDATSTTPKDASSSTNFSLTNNFLHNLFSSIHINVNQANLAFSFDNYPYLGYIQNLFNYSPDFQTVARDVYLWCKDTPGKMDSFGKSSTDNVGAQTRHKWIAPGNKVRGILKLRVPLFELDKYLFNKLDVDIVMNRTENPKFFFMSNDSATFSFKLDSIVLRMRKVRMIKSFTDAVESFMLNTGRNLDYVLTNPVVTTKTYSGYGSDIIEDNLFQGVLPKRIIIGIVGNDAYKGTFPNNPFNFVSNGMKEIGIFVNGTPHPIPMTQMDFTKKSTHRILHLMYESVQGVNPLAPALGISKEEFDSGFTLFSFDMSSDQHGGLNHHSLFNEPANVRLHFRFAQGNATDLITLIVYYETSQRMSVTATRQVTVYK